MRALAVAAALWASFPSVVRANECWQMADGTVTCTKEGFGFLVSEARFQQSTREKCEATNARLAAEVQAAKERADAAENQSLLPVVAAGAVGVVVGFLLSALAR